MSSGFTTRFFLEVLPPWVGPFEDEHAEHGLVPRLFRTIQRYMPSHGMTVAQVVKNLSHVIVPTAHSQHAKLQAFLATSGSDQMVDSWSGNSVTCCYPACTILAPREKYCDISVQIPHIGCARPYVLVLRNAFLPLGSIFSDDLHEDETLVLRPMTLSELKDGVLDNYLVWVGQTFIATTHDQGVYEATLAWRQYFLNGSGAETTNFEFLASIADNENGKKIAPPPGFALPTGLLDEPEVEAPTEYAELSGEETADHGRASPQQALHPDGRSGPGAVRKHAASENWRLQLKKRDDDDDVFSWDSPRPRGWPQAPSPSKLPIPTFLLEKQGEKKNGNLSTESKVTPQTPNQPSPVAASNAGSSVPSISTRPKSRYTDLFREMEQKVRKPEGSATADSTSNNEGNQTKRIFGVAAGKTDRELLPPAEIIPRRDFRRNSTPTIRQKPTFQGSMFPLGNRGMPMGCDGGYANPEALQAQVAPLFAVIKGRSETWPGVYPCQSPGGSSSGSSPREPLSVPMTPEYYTRRVFVTPGAEEDENDIFDETDEFFTPDTNQLQDKFPIYDPPSDQENDADMEDEDGLEDVEGDEPASVYCDADDSESGTVTDSEYDEDEADESDVEEVEDLVDDDRSSEDDDEIVDPESGGVSVMSPPNLVPYFFPEIKTPVFGGVRVPPVDVIRGVHQLDHAGLPVSVQCY